MGESHTDKHDAPAPPLWPTREQIDAWHDEAMRGNKTAVNRLHDASAMHIIEFFRRSTVSATRADSK